MDRNQKAFVNVQLQQFQKHVEGQLGVLVQQLNQSFSQLGNNVTGCIAAINTLTVQQESILDQLIESGAIDKDKLQEDVKKRFEEENKHREEMMEDLRKQQEAIAHAENNNELEDCGEDHYHCEGCRECEFEAQFKETKEEVVEETPVNSDTVLASERNNIVKFPG